MFIQSLRLHDFRSYHQVLVMLLEQIYRAYQIDAGTRYHK